MSQPAPEKMAPFCVFSQYTVINTEMQIDINTTGQHAGRKRLWSARALNGTSVSQPSPRVGNQLGTDSRTIDNKSQREACSDIAFAAQDRAIACELTGL